MAPAPATIFPSMLIDLAETMANRLETGGVEELTPEDVSTATPL